MSEDLDKAANKESNRNLRLWYAKPADPRAWVEALPIGNGRLGGMVFGGEKIEHVQLNEDSVWYGGPRDRNNPDALQYLPEMRRLILSGQPAEAERLATLALSGTPESERHYQPLGDLFIEVTGHGSSVSDYMRELDLNDAVARVSYAVDGVRFTREIFVSAVDQVMVLRFCADRPRMISLKVRITRDRYYDRVRQEPPNGLMMEGLCGGEGGSVFRSLVVAQPEGGTIRLIGDNLLVEAADAVTLLLSAATTFRYADPDTTCRSMVHAAARKQYEQLKRDHIAEYRSHFSTLSISLSAADSPIGPDGGSNGEVELSASLPTNQRLQRVREGADDPGLVSLFFQYGRYLLISSSSRKPACQPAGIWNKEMRPPWDSKVLSTSTRR